MAGYEVRKWRDRLGMSQVEAAANLGITERTLRRYETGKMTDGRPYIVPKTVKLAMAAVRRHLPPERA